MPKYIIKAEEQWTRGMPSPTYYALVDVEDEVKAIKEWLKEDTMDAEELKEIDNIEVSSMSEHRYEVADSWVFEVINLEELQTKGRIVID